MRQGSMIVTVMRVREMGMNVRDCFVAVLMAVPCPWQHRFLMCMLMVFVVDVFMLMPQDLMGMFMLMLLGQMQPYSQRHQGCGQQ